MDKLTLNIYDETGKIIKTVEAQPVHLKLGFIRKIMELLNIEGCTNSFELLGKVYGAWEELQKLLATIFPGVTEEEWDNVDLSELVPLIMNVVKFTIATMNGIPNDPKNLMGA